VYEAGPHTFQVRAVLNGNTDPTPASYTWKVDTTPPAVTGLVCPPAKVNASEVSIAFASEAGATFDCTLDTKSAACTSPAMYATLALGPHTFSVVAKDAAGNVSKASDATCNFEVTGITPNTTATCPAALINTSSVSVAFTADISGATFKCQLDTAAAAACSSPDMLTGLADGDHTLDITATAGGATEPSPAECKFTVDTKPPTVKIVSGPANDQTTGPSVTFNFTSDDPKATFACTFQGATAACNTGSATYTGLKPTGAMDPEYQFSVVATDLAGNASQPDSRHFKVGTGPGITIKLVPKFGPVDGPISSPDGHLEFSAVGGETGIMYSNCMLDSTPVACTSPVNFSGLQDGAHKFTLTAVNTLLPGTDATHAERDFNVDAKAPVVTINLPATGVYYNTGIADLGHFPALNIATLSFSATDDEGLTGDTWACDIGGNTFDCAPDQEFPLQSVLIQALAGVQYPVLTTLSPTTYEQFSRQTVNVQGTDIYGNSSGSSDPVSQTFLIDVVGPSTIEFTSGPGIGEQNSISCPSQADGLDAPFQFDVPANAQLPADPSAISNTEGPVWFKCALDTTVTRPFSVNQTDVNGHCDTGPYTPGCLFDCQNIKPSARTGELAWDDLSNGTHTLTVIAYDQYNNPGPVTKVENTIVYGTTVSWTVDRQAPVITFDDAPDLNTPSGPNGTIGFTVVDPMNQHQVNVTACITDVDVANSTKVCDDFGPTIGSGHKTADFSNLMDQNTGGLYFHTISITAHDFCGNKNTTVNTHTASEPWTVDSTGQTIDIVGFRDPQYVDTGTGDTVTNGTNRLRFTLSDAHSDSDPPNDHAEPLAEAQPTVTIIGPEGPQTLTGHNLTCTTTNPANDTMSVLNQEWWCDFSYAVPLGGAGGPGLNTLYTAKISSVDEVGNKSIPAEKDVDFIIDINPPLLSKTDTSPQVSTCVNGTDTVVSKSDGVINFVSSDSTATANFDCELTDITGASGPTSVSCMQGTTTTGGWNFSYTFTGLTDNHKYNLTVIATDKVGNKSAPLSVTWSVDGSNPLIVFQKFHPTTGCDPQAPTGDCGFEDVAALNSTNPTSNTTPFTPTGYFSLNDPYDGTNTTTYTCSIDGGATFACTPAGGYAVDGLVEGQHNVKVVGTDCVGNVTPDNGANVYHFYVDRTEPHPVITAAGDGTYKSSTGDAALAVDITDPIVVNSSTTMSNVAQLYCILDDLTATLNACPDVGVLASGVLNSPSPRALPTWAGETHYTASLALSKLASGRHVLRYAATDHWGHRSAETSVGFTVDFDGTNTGVRGHAIVMGQDFSEYIPPPPAPGKVPATTAPTLETQKILGNGTLLSGASAFTRPMHVFIAAMQNKSANETNNLRISICQRLCEKATGGACAQQSNTCDTYALFRELSFDGASVSTLLDMNTPSSFINQLMSQDVVVFADVNNPSEGAKGALDKRFNSGSTWAKFLSDDAALGRVYITTSGASPIFSPNGTNAIPSGTFEITRGLIDVNVEDSWANGTATMIECNSTDPLRASIAGADSGSWSTSYSVPAYAVRFYNNERTNNDTNMPTEVWEIEDLDNIDLPTVLHKYFPQRPDVGPVYVDAYDFTGGSNGNPLGFGGAAVFQQYSDGDITHVQVCPIDGNGHVSREVNANAIVTAYAENDSGDPYLLSLYQVSPYELIVLGQANSSPITTETIVLPSYTPPATQSPVVDFITSSGCDTNSTVTTNVSTVTTYTTKLNFSNRCLNSSGNYEVIAVGLDPADHTTARWAWTKSSTGADSSTLSTASWSGPVAVNNKALTVEPNPAPVSGQPVVFTLAENKTGNVYFNEGLSGTSAQNYNTFYTISGFNEGFRGEELVRFSTDTQSAFLDIGFLSVEGGLASGTYNLDSTQLLPHVSNPIVSNTFNQDAYLHWTRVASDSGWATYQNIGVATIGLAQMTVNTGCTRGGDARWTLNFTPSTDEGAINLPLVPQVNNLTRCSPVGDTARSVDGLLFGQQSSITAVDTHRVMMDTVVEITSPLFDAANQQATDIDMSNSTIRFSAVLPNSFFESTNGIGVLAR
jgi:hypothetical protein